MTGTQIQHLVIINEEYIIIFLNIDMRKTILSTPNIRMVVTKNPKVDPILKVNLQREFKRWTNDPFFKSNQRPPFERLNPEE